MHDDTLSIAESKSTCVVAVPAGALGTGVSGSEVRRGIALGADVIAIDAGSTDSGPYYLGSAQSKYSRESVKQDLATLMAAANESSIPILVGSCGTSGTDEGVRWTAEIVKEIAQQHNYKFRVALLMSEITKQLLATKVAAGLTRPLDPSPSMHTSTIDECDHIVAVMGAEPYIEALKRGADIVLGGRTTDPALIAALPLIRGTERALAWHAGKVTECGALCTAKQGHGGVLANFAADSFSIEPLDETNSCTPETVAAHLLYENADPFNLKEPGGTLDASKAQYMAVTERITKVWGARWRSTPYTMKLEGAGGGAFQTLILAGIRDPHVLGSLELFSKRLLDQLYERVGSHYPNASGCSLSLRFFGWDAVGDAPVRSQTGIPGEVGLLFIVTAPTQELATQIAKTCNPTVLHFPLELDTELPSYAFPFSPAEVERGELFEFKINHVVEVDHPSELVRTEWFETMQ